MTESRISKQPIKKETLTPRRQLIKQAKAIFLEELSNNGGNVSKALVWAGISRKTAYSHRDKDKRFADAWMEVLETVNDAVVDEIRRRGIEGTEKPVFRNGEIVGITREYSDTLLIYLHKQTAYRKYGHVEWLTWVNWSSRSLRR